ncbi:MAG: hypothetical protein J5I93_17965 [Pirellulaceae bacterium]|nr:hypothetical protein [Pirellulaceae bacterium]
MTREEIARRITANLEQHGIRADDLRLLEDPFAGWRVAIVSSGFEGMPRRRRQQIALSNFEDVVIQWAELLTPTEREWSGDLFLNADLEELPSWPEALARRRPESQVVFASDLEDDLPRPIIATFYSLRGGVGRSTALAYTGRILASRGRSVLCVDMDLEAPGLGPLFGREDALPPGHGLASVLIELDQGGRPDVLQHIVRLSESNELYCLPAGVPSADYARRLRLIDPESWYREDNNPLRVLIDLLRDLPIKPDVLLLDARTGMTPLSAPLLFDLSDLAFITLFPHPQARRGTGELVRALLNSHSRREVDGRPLTPEPRFIVSMVPDTKVPEIVQRYQRRAQDWISEWLSPLEQLRPHGLPPIDASDVMHVVPYAEVIATSDRILPDKDAWRFYVPIAEWLERFLATESEVATAGAVANVKAEILERLDFSAGTAERQDNFLESFVRTDLVERAMSPSMPLVLGRKGTGKTAVFRRLLEGTDYQCTAVMAPADFRRKYPWVLGIDAFKAIDGHLNGTDSSWREFWSLFTPLAIWLSAEDRGALPQPRGPLASLIAGVDDRNPISELRLVERLREVLLVRDVGMLSWGWLADIDTELEPDHFALFDGLDTGFGQESDDRGRRAKAIQGLFTFIMDRESGLRHLRFKVLLREDIWRTVRFENKSHLYGRSVRLEWQRQSDYAKTMLKQAGRVAEFARLAERQCHRSMSEVDDWSEEAVFKAWDVLVGERMKGGKTAYTRNWVWNRLADGNGDHTPRALLQLFREATDQERDEQSRSTYEKSIIRPRALIMSLDKVSEEAVQALLEEFTELNDLVVRLREIGRSPLEANELANVAELGLAREVGLLEVYEGTEEDVRRYRVPDLYRLAIGMTRKGQA